nr:hypothetical protein [uncultured Carboxylicivirga sp.]
MSDRAKINIKELSDKLIELVRNSCWNDFSNSYAYIISEIVNDDKNFFEKRIERKKQNSKKSLLNIEQAREEIDKIYENLYDVNFYVYKATKNKTIIEIQYYPKSSLDKDYFKKVKENEPMLHCKVSIPIYLQNDKEKFDVNWELGGIRYKWNMLLYKNRVKKELANAKTK